MRIFAESLNTTNLLKIELFQNFINGRFYTICDIIMGKIKVRTGRGTGTVEVDDTGKKWAGAAYKKHQEEIKEKSKDKYITVGRGTGKIKFGDMASTELKSTKGVWVSTGRGTGKRKLK